MTAPPSPRRAAAPHPAEMGGGQANSLAGDQSNDTRQVRRLGASVEVIQHHTTQHVARCGSHPINEYTCPCGTAIVLVCTGCNDVVFLATPPHRWCVHADEVWRWAS